MSSIFLVFFTLLYCCIKYSRVLSSFLRFLVHDLTLLIPFSIRRFLFSQSVHVPLFIGRRVTDWSTRPIGDDWDWIQSVKQETWHGHWIGRDKKDIDLVILYFHGGGFTYGHSTMYMPTFRLMIDQLLNVHGIHARILSVNYSLSPEYTWPKATNECFDAYKYLIDDAGISPNRIILAGDSAGGNLVASTILNIKNSSSKNDNPYPMPAGGALISPWIDITPNLPGFSTFKSQDVISPLHIDLYTHHYIPGYGSLKQSERDTYLKDPRLSPFYGDFHHTCPLLVTFGDQEMLSGSISDFIQQLLKEGCHVDTIEGKEAAHIWMVFPLMAKSKLHFEKDCEKMITWMATQYKQSCTN